jgi:O-methyltransferase
MLNFGDSLLPQRVLAELLELAALAPAGHFAEFGVYRGGTAFYLAEIARAQARRIYLFDTFTGIPVSGPHDTHKVGEFADTSLESVRELIPDAIIVPGIFPDSLEDFTVAPLAFVHVDADQYESIAASTKYFPPRMVPGGVMIFDDYGVLSGATRAIHEWGEPIEVTKRGKALWRKITK